jgi:predicted nucleotidyltransferase
VRTVGLITEYNPFHNGHLYHLQESLRVTDADASVAVMSGHFLQRGEPALLDKWSRTEMALAAGVDLVLELPFCFACNSAPSFARGAVQSLNAFGVVDALCFGSEAGVVEPLQAAARLLLERADDIDAATRKLLRSGVSYPAARAEVLSAMDTDVSAALISSPNNILGIEYLKALQEISSPIKAFTILRRGVGYHSTDVTGSIASATGIRKLLGDGGSVVELLPKACQQILNDALDAGGSLDHDRLFSSLQIFLLQELETLSGVYQIEDGLAQRLVDAAMTATSYSDLSEKIKSRQWTLTRIQRILSYVLLQVSSVEMNRFLESGPLYLRLLGATVKGRQLLADSRKKRSLPVISDPARAQAVLRRFYSDRRELGHLAERMLACDLRATRLYGLMQQQPQSGHRNQDFFRECLGAGKNQEIVPAYHGAVPRVRPSHGEPS